VTPLKFDNQYFINLKNNLGLFTSDESLFNDPRTVKLVEYYASHQKAFFEQFGISLRKMGKISVLTGSQGQIRKQCWVRNSDNVDPALDPISLNFTDSTAN
jgi:peroxidase